MFLTSESLANINLIPLVTPVKISLMDMINEIVEILKILSKFFIGFPVIWLHIPL